MIISPLFDSVSLNEKGQMHAKDISVAFTNLLLMLGDVLPPGREFAIVRTKLEEASFYAKKALSTDNTNW